MAASFYYAESLAQLLVHANIDYPRKLFIEVSTLTVQLLEYAVGDGMGYFLIGLLLPPVSFRPLPSTLFTISMFILKFLCLFGRSTVVYFIVMF